MQPAVEGALIAAAVGTVGILATAATALLAPRSARKTARDERLWAKEAALYEELLADTVHEVAIREDRFRILRYDEETEKERAERLQRPDPDWFALEGRIRAYTSNEVLATYVAWRNAEGAAHLAKTNHSAASQAGSANARDLAEEAEEAREKAKAAFEELVTTVQKVLKRKK